MPNAAIEQLKEWIDKKGWTQAGFALQVGTYQSTVSYLLSGTRPPSWDLAFRIEELTGISAKALRERAA